MLVGVLQGILQDAEETLTAWECLADTVELTKNLLPLAFVAALSYLPGLQRGYLAFGIGSSPKVSIRHPGPNQGSFCDRPSGRP